MSLISEERIAEFTQQLMLTISLGALAKDEKIVREVDDWTREFVRHIVRETAEACAKQCNDDHCYGTEKEIRKRMATG